MRVATHAARCSGRAAPIHVSGMLQAVIYIGLAGTLILGIWPKPFMEYTVAATTLFAHLGPAPVASTLP